VIKKTAALLLVVITCYCVALLVFMPLSFAWEQASKWLPRQYTPVGITARRGTLWNGEAQIVHSYFKGTVSWQLQPWKVLFGERLIALQARTAEGYAEGQGGFVNGQFSINGQLSVDLRILKPLLSKHRIDLGGKLVVKDLQIVVESQTSFPVATTGKAHWEGGRVSYPLGLRRQSVTMPPLQAVIAQQGEDVLLVVNEDQTSNMVMQLLLTRQGSVQVQIRKRLLDLAGAPWSGDASPDDVVFKIQQKLI
jgi:general secretion pathway protein N